MSSKGYALARAELIRVLTAYSGVTTEDGLPGGTTLVDANLKDNPSISAHAIPEKSILIMSGDAIMEDKGATSFVNATGTITLQGTGFSTQIKAGTIFRILNISSVEIDVADIDTKIGTNTDPAGTTTLFAWLAKIFAGSSDIFDLVNAMLVLAETGGTITTTGGEDDVYINDAPAGVYDPQKVMIDLTPMTATETVVIRTYYRIKSTGNLILKDEVTFAGAQDPPLINVELEPNRFGCKVTITRTAGDDLAYDWEVLYKA